MDPNEVDEIANDSSRGHRDTLALRAYDTWGVYVEFVRYEERGSLRGGVFEINILFVWIYNVKLVYIDILMAKL